MAEMHMTREFSTMVDIMKSVREDDDPVRQARRALQEAPCGGSAFSATLQRHLLLLRACAGTCAAPRLSCVLCGAGGALNVSATAPLGIAAGGGLPGRRHA